MRVTNKMLSNNFLRDMQTNLTNLNKIQGQMTSGKQITRPSDDPFKATKIMQMSSDIEANKQYNTNINNSINWLDTTDTALGQVGDVIGRINELLVSAGNGGYGADQRQAIKDEINQKVGEVSQIINTSFDGKYIFGGTSATTKPMGTVATGQNTDLVSNIKPKVVTKITGGIMSYDGNTVALGSTFNMSINGVSMPVATSAAITEGATTMATTASTLQTDINTAIASANLGKLPGDPTIISAATVTATADGGFDISSLSGTVTFSDNPGGSITKDLGLSVGSKDTLLVEVSQGVTMDYNVTATQVVNYGTGAGDNLMQLLKNIVNHLDSTDSNDTKELTTSDLTGIQAAMTNVLKVRSEVGSKQNRMESAQSRNEDNNFNMTEILSKTEDIDITEKSMEYATMQTIYMASLQTSAKVIQPTLLDYLR